LANGLQDEAAASTDSGESGNPSVDFRILVENAREAIIVVQDRIIRYANHGVSSLVGYTAREFTSNDFISYVHPDDREKVLDRHERRLAGENPPDKYPLRLLHLNGSSTWVDLRVMTIEMDGRPASLVYLTDISEQVKAETGLRESEAILRSIQEAAPIGIGLAMPTENRILWANQRMSELTGYSNQELTAMNTIDLYESEKEFRRARKVFQEKFGGELGSVETRFKHKDGSNIQILMNFAPIKVEESEPGVVFTITDLTGIKAAEDARRLSEEKFEKAFKGSPAWVTITTLDQARFLEVNDAFVTGTGYTREEALGRTAVELGLWINSEDFNKAMAALKRDGFARNMEFPTRVKSGEVRHIMWSSEAIEYDGQASRINVMIDVTEQKKAERELRDREERLRALVDSSSDAIVTLDIDGDFVSCNPAFTIRFGLTQEEVLGESGEIIHVSSDAYREFANEAFSAVKRTGSFRKEYSYRNRAGEVFPMETVISALRRADGKVAGYVAVMRDMTERKRAEKERDRLESQLRQAQKMEAIGTLAGGIAHDFNNILTAIIGYTELLLTEISPKIPAGHNLEQVLIAGMRAKELVSQILTFSRQSDQELKPANLTSVVKEALKLLRSSLPTTIEIKQEIAAHSGAAIINPTQVHQLLLNLCTNAAQAMEPDGGTLKVSLRKEDLARPRRIYGGQLRPGSYYRLTVNDTGKGMEQELLEKIFDPYFTTKEQGRGTGLGLSVVHGIVTAHQGGVNVASHPGAGTTFDIYLPAATEAPVEKTEANDPLPTGTERILFVDDEAVLTDVGKKTLSLLGYQVTVMNDSRDALRTFLDEPGAFDLIITDQTMPGITGMELAQRAMEARSDIPVILCTGYSNQVDQEQALKGGVRDFLMKPMVVHTLAQAVRRVLDGANGTNDG
jgi:PAS domain S-box-containing protein